MKRRVAVLLLTLSLLLFVTPATASILWADAPNDALIPRDTLVRYQSDGIPYFLYLPSTASTARPLTPLLAIHAFGEDARGFASRMIPQADHYGWFLVAPDLPSGDWKDYQVIQSDARRNLPWLHGLVHSLP